MAKELLICNFDKIYHIFIMNFINRQNIASFIIIITN
jgi:hypothetical protein